MLCRSSGFQGISKQYALCNIIRESRTSCFKFQSIHGCSPSLQKLSIQFSIYRDRSNKNPSIRAIAPKAFSGVIPIKRSISPKLLRLKNPITGISFWKSNWCRPRRNIVPASIFGFIAKSITASIIIFTFRYSVDFPTDYIMINLL